MVEVVPALGRVGCGRLPPLHPPVCPEVGSGKSYNPGSSVCTPAPPQICFLMAVTVIGQRMNFMVILHGCWLVALLTRRHRAAIARLWPNYCLFLALFLLYQYLLCLGIPPALCLGELAASTEGVGVPGGGYGIPRRVAGPAPFMSLAVQCLLFPGVLSGTIQSNQGSWRWHARGSRALVRGHARVCEPHTLRVGAWARDGTAFHLLGPRTWPRPLGGRGAALPLAVLCSGPFCSGWFLARGFAGCSCWGRHSTRRYSLPGTACTKECSCPLGAPGSPAPPGQWPLPPEPSVCAVSTSADSRAGCGRSRCPGALVGQLVRGQGCGSLPASSAFHCCHAPSVALKGPLWPPRGPGRVRWGCSHPTSLPHAAAADRTMSTAALSGMP